jgi:transglutaminase-like putative cysteine protease
MVASDAQTVTAIIRYEILTKDFAVSRWFVYLPQPPELPSQSEISIRESLPAKVVTERSALLREVRYVDLPVPQPAAGASLQMELEVRATLRSRMLVPLGSGEKAPVVAPLTTAEQAAYTAPGPTLDFGNKVFAAWLDKRQLHSKKNEAPLQLASRILTAIRADFGYRFDMQEAKNVSLVCARPSTDCAGMSYLFVGALRANGIPARALVGRLAKPRKVGAGPNDNGHDQPHVRAEMYVANIGWVPVDPTFANVDKARPVDAFLGNDTGDMIVLHIDPDLQLPFPDQERTANSLQAAPFYWTFGQGVFDGKFGPTGWELQSAAIGMR